MKDLEIILDYEQNRYRLKLEHFISSSLLLIESIIGNMTKLNVDIVNNLLAWCTQFLNNVVDCAQIPWRMAYSQENCWNLDWTEAF